MMFKIFPQISLKIKFFLILLLTSGLSLLFTCSILVVNDLLQFRQSLVKELIDQAGLVGENSSAALVFNDQETAQEILSAFQHQSNILQAILLTPTGDILAQYKPGLLPDQLLVFNHVTSHVSWESVKIWRPITFNDEQVGTIYMHSNLQAMYERLQDLLIVTIVAMMLSSLVALLISSRLQQVVLSPLINLTNVATRISQTQDYSLRAPIRTPDEIGTLIDGFNTMLQEIQDREKELEQHRAHLSDMVSERTTELSATNVRLHNEITERERISQDILNIAADLKDKNEELAVSRDAALQAAKAKAEFLATMSHEIRTPMNGVIGMTDLLLGTSLTADQQYFANTVRSSADALLTLLNDILDFSKIESGKLQLESLDFNINSMVEDTLDLLAERASQNQVELTGLVFPDVPTRLKGDPGRIRQILLNLVGNAIKFAKQGEVSVQVLFMDESASQVELQFHVWDTGIGISPEVKSKLFHAFSQADSSTTRQYGGTGLGLAICKQLVELMDGSISMESQPGAWSLFWFSVKLEKASPHRQPEWLPRPDLQGLRVLCVDDNPTNLFLLETYTTTWRMEVMTTLTPQHGLSILQEAAASDHPFDLVVLDRAMPEIDGLQLGRLIKQDPNLTHTKLLLLTSIGQRGEAAAAHDAGFAGYLTKPLHKVQLHDEIATVMGYGLTKEPESTRPLVTRHTSKETQRLSRLKILVADDHAINQQLIVLLLERLGYRSDVTTTGREAVEAAATGSYALILMDCQMPEMDGFEATRVIRKMESEKLEVGSKESDASDTSHLSRLPSHLRIPIIALTANAMPGDREKCLAAGMDDYLSKPIRQEELVAILERWLLPDTNDPRQKPLKPQDKNQSSDSILPSQSTDETPQIVSQDFASETPSPINAVILEEWRELGGPEFVTRMVGQFVTDARTCVEAIEQALDGHDGHALAEAVHGLKGICANIGATHLQHLALNIEHAHREGTSLNGPQTIAMLKTAMSQITIFLTTVQFPRR